MAKKRKVVDVVNVPPKVHEAPIGVEVAPAVLLVAEPSPAKVEEPVPLSAYPFRTVDSWNNDAREICKLEACPYGGNGIVLRLSTRFLDTDGNVTACSESMCTVPGVSMSTFNGSRRGKKEL